MKSGIFQRAAHLVAVLALAAGVNALAQTSHPAVFSGVINAYTPQTTTGPYEVRGPWSLTVKADSGLADFSAALNMEFSDGWVLTKNNGDFDPNARGAHTHHITMTNGVITLIPNGFQVMGPASFTLSGGPAPSTVSPSILVIQITGGSVVKYSNISLTFQTPGSNHFGTAPLPGVVQSIQ
jgi:hypothetical protein